MQAFQDLYTQLLRSAGKNPMQPALEIQKDGFDPYQLDCLLHPGKYAPVWHFGNCDCSETASPCIKSCLFQAIQKDEKGNVIIDKDLCAGCCECIEACKSGKLTASRDILPTLSALKNPSKPAYAMIAPAFVGQFEKDVTPGKLRSAFKQIGFAGMVEVALFADILTLKEALEFNRRIVENEDFLITSCCCPIWIAMIRNAYRQYIHRIPDAVSPMVACGRAIKILEPNATTVFIGPCIAKKSEARERDIAGAVDFVLTFEETRDIFDAFHIEPGQAQDDSRDHSSRVGRIYGRKGGVSEAVRDTVGRLNPDRAINVHARQADGIQSCKELLNTLKEGRLNANFLEGMGCPGGCVGGPKAMLNREEGRENVNRYGGSAVHETPIDNPFVLDLLKRLGIDSVESLLNETDIFTRHFN